MQQQLADMVYVSARTIISIEKEQYSPSLMLAYRLARVFGTSVEDLCLLEMNRQLKTRRTAMNGNRVNGEFVLMAPR